MHFRIQALVLLAGCGHLLATEGNDLSGVVTDMEGKPLAQMSVHIYTAAVRAGVSPLCPGCYTDCAKYAITDPEGRFLIPDLDPELIFRVLAVGDGYKPQFVDKVDPTKGTNLEVRLTPFDPHQADPKRIVRGRVVDEHGKGIPQATLVPEHFKTSGWEGFSPGIFDPLAVTAGDGSFVIAASQDIDSVYLKVAARGFAPRGSGKLLPGQIHQLEMKSGVTIRGQVVQGEKPLAGVKVGMVQKTRSGPVDYPHYRGESFYGEMEIGTNEDGQFLFTQVPAGTSFFIYGIMDTLKDHGAIAASLITTLQDGSTLETGNLEVRPGHVLEGRVVLSDGQPIPPRTRLMLSRDDAWDHQMLELPSDGKFQFPGLPDEGYSLSVQIRGYGASPLNKSINRLSDSELMGTIDTDIRGLRFLLEKGAKADREAVYQSTTWDFTGVKESPLEGAPE